MQLNYERQLYIKAYNSLFGGTGKLSKDEGLHITRAEYANGYALICI